MTPAARLYRVRLFAAARDRVGRESIEVPEDGVGTVGQLRAAIEQRYPELKSILSYATFAVDQEYAAETTPVDTDQEIALIPPVSGG